MSESINPTSVRDYGKYYNLGDLQRSISTSNPEAQSWFNYGLVWCYGFNHEEAVICFQHAADKDPECAIAYWGLAYALGPNYNRPWELFGDEERVMITKRIHDAIAKARQYSSLASDVEQRLIEALAFRYPEGETNKSSLWSEEYARGMKNVYEQYPDDFDIVTLYADACMNLKPWDLWNLKTGEPTEGAHTLEVKAILEKAMEQRHGVDHPGLLHLYIHLMELSSTPESALQASGYLETLVPDSGHLCHMPSHIYILCGDYKRAVAVNRVALLADSKFRDRSGSLNFYTLYICHNAHFLIYAAMFAGQKDLALKTIEATERNLPEELLRFEYPPMADFLESFISIRIHILIRFGMWKEILDLKLPDDPELYCVTTAMFHYGRGVAHAALGDIPSAQSERALFAEALKKVKPTRVLFTNKCTDILEIAQEMLDGELEYRKNNVDVAFEHLRKAIDLENNLKYDEPWAWMQPVRHALGALSLEQGKVEEAAAIYRADLGLDETLLRPQRHPNNVWALHGYHECLVRLGNTREAEEVKAMLDKALLGADIPIKSSCYCRLDTEKEKCCD